MLSIRIALCVVAVAAVSAINYPAYPQQLADQQILRRGNGAEPATLDPHKMEGDPEIQIASDLFEGLVTMGNDNKVAPAAAESWTLSPDGKTYTFKLRAGLKWSNGDPLTAEDFVYSFRRAVDPATGSRYGVLYYPVKNAEDIVNGKNKDVSSLGVRAVDATTLEITLAAPTGYFLSLLRHNTFVPVERSNVEKFGAEFTRPGNLVSNGAFMLKEWTPQSRVVVVKNPNYREADKVKLTEVDFFPVENQNEEFKRYRAGELDVTYPSGLPGDQMDFIRQNMPAELVLPPMFGNYYVAFNVTRPPFKDAQKLRTALSMVIDRDVIVDKITKQGQKPAYGWVPPGIPGYEAQSVSWKDLPMAERIAEAKKLYAEAGYGPDHPFKVEIRYNTSENHKKIMIAIAAMWKQALGVQTSLINEEWKVFLETRAAKKVTEVTREGWIGDYLDPNAFAELELSKSGMNDSGYSNPEYDGLVEKAAATVDAGEKFKLLEQAESIFLRDMPIVPLYYYVNGYLVKPYVQGFSPNLIGAVHSKDIAILRH